MKRFLCALTVLAIAGPAAAISRYNAPSMTCEAARQAIRSQGAVILRYPSTRVKSLTLYDRYVRNSGQCDDGQYAERAYVPTRDNPRCPVLQCKPIDRIEGFIGIIPRLKL